MRATRLAVLALLLGASALAGCDKARQATGTEAATSCIGCHGGAENASGAPPNDTVGNTASAAPGVGAHTKHIDAGYDCEACHVKPSRLRDPGHIDGEAKITFGQMARKPDATAVPAYDKNTHTCSNVYCHGGRMATGDRGQATTPSWTASPLPGAPCASCHGTAAAFGAPPAPGHPGGFTGTADCNRCHPGTVDADGNLILVGAGGQHLDGEVQIAASACNLCHGDRSGARVADAGKPAAFAPPFDVAGATTGTKVGAHLRHVSSVAGVASRVSQPFACTECHVYPGSSGPHVVPPGTVVDFDVAHTSVATAGGQVPVYTPATGSCATTWCHGTALNAGGTAAGRSPTWNSSGADCGTCHFQGSTVSQAPAHPQVDAVTGGQPITANTQCYKCHANTVNPDGTINISYGQHVNGHVESTSPHAAGWVAVDGGTHRAVAKRNLSSCAPCHGADFGTVVSTVGGNGKSCNTCHANPVLFVPGYAGPLHPAWKTECTFCHGDPSRSDVAAQDAVGTPAVNAGKVNPPQGTQEELNASNNAVGAHLRHMSDSPTLGNRYATPFKCQQCHGGTVLTDAAHQGVGHVDGRVSIGWQVAATGITPTITPPLAGGSIPAARDATGAARTPAAVSCANYCHGATMSGGTLTTVTWSAAGSVTGCTPCHGNPPSYAAPSWHAAGANAADCAQCHGASGTSDNTTHVNGTVNLLGTLTCHSCHGSATNDAPPGTASANVTEADARVGAHQAHVTAGPLARAFTCAACHGTPPSSMSHADGAVTITWSTLASASSVVPSPTAGTKQPGGTTSCSNYCHGGRWAPGGPAANPNYVGAITSPSWTGGPSQVDCGACHKVAPTTGAHSAVNAVGSTINCSTCHTGYNCLVSNLGACTVNTSAHVNGTIDANLTCFSCHGTTGGSVAPPLATSGATTTSDPKVGAHQAHLTKTNQRTAALACTDCHTVPAATTHSDGTVQLTWSSLASTGTTPTPASLSGPALAAWESTPTCTNYCHGTFPGGLNAAVSWTGGTVGCASCHAFPPAISAAAKHPQNVACGSCHPGYGTGTPNKAAHINGVRTFPTGCAACHGDLTAPAPLAPSDSRAAPGFNASAVDSHGSAATSSRGVGAHQNHLGTLTFRAAPIACGECHLVPGALDTGHVDGNAAAVTFGTLAKTAWAGQPAITPALSVAGATVSCASTYCHGNFGGGAKATVTWNPPTTTACGTCHGLPPAFQKDGVTAHPANTACAGCHGAGYSTTTVNLSLHVNGALDLAAQSCNSCHGSAANNAPPSPTSGSTATTNPKVGAHQKHVTGTTLRAGALRCEDCHTVPASTTHSDGTVQLTWSTLASASAVSPTPGNLAGAALTTWEATPNCTNYCHGGKWAGDATRRGTNTTVSWTGGSANTACNSCHQAPPAGTHPTVGLTESCSTCHSGYTCTPNALATCLVNTAVHMNGTPDVNAAGSSCVGCHASAVTGTVNRRAIVREFGYAWSHKRSASPAGTVTNNDCAVCHMEGVAATGAIDTSFHKNGLINLRDPDLGTQIKQVSWGGTGAGAYSSTAADATFATFSRNLSSNVLEPAVQAMMINQCLKCHDANGAASTLARVPTGSAAKPFGTTIGSTANYTGSGVTALGTAGGVTDVNASFATTNSSYHPVRGKQNNANSAGTRMVAPWSMTKTAGVSTGWGYLISCWDCHAPQGASGLQTLTVTAHGGTTTLRGTAVHATGGTQPNAAGAVTLCNACHQYYNTCGTAADACASTTSHGSGSAFSSNPGRSTKSNYLRYACNKCHASSYTTAVVRPVRAMDTHGTNSLPAAGTKTGRWSTDPRPYAFIRNTQMFSSHQPKSIGATTYNPTCVHLTDGDCSSRTETYSAGGTY